MLLQVQLSKLQGWLVIYGLLAAGVVIAGGSWAFADRFGFRPAFKFEVDEVRSLAVSAATKLEWLEWNNLKQIKEQRRLTPKECAEFLALGRSLGVPTAC